MIIKLQTEEIFKMRELPPYKVKGIGGGCGDKLNGVICKEGGDA